MFLCVRPVIAYLPEAIRPFDWVLCRFVSVAVYFFDLACLFSKVCLPDQLRLADFNISFCSTSVQNPILLSFFFFFTITWRSDWYARSAWLIMPLKSNWKCCFSLRTACYIKLLLGLDWKWVVLRMCIFRVVFVWSLYLLEATHCVRSLLMTWYTAVSCTQMYSTADF